MDALRMAIRALSRRPGVTALAVSSLGLAIGFCTVGFSLLDAGLLRALPVREPARLQWLYARDREQRVGRTRSWEGVLAECRMGPKVRLPARDDSPIAAGVSENYFLGRARYDAGGHGQRGPLCGASLAAGIRWVHGFGSPDGTARSWE